MNKKSESEGLPFIGWLLLPFFLVFSFLQSIVDLFTLIFDSPARKERREQQLNQELYERVLNEFPRNKQEFLGAFIERHDYLEESILDKCLQFIDDIWELEEFDLPSPPPVANSIEGARYRDTLSQMGDIQPSLKSITESLSYFTDNIPKPDDSEGVFFLFSLRETISPRLLLGVILPFYNEGAYLPKLRLKLDKNLHNMSGVPFTQENYNSPKLVMPTEYKGDAPLINYIVGTPLYKLFDVTTEIKIPFHHLYEHVHITGSTGAGKTQLLQMLLLQLLDTDCSTIVIDSQHKLIDNIKRLEFIDPDRLVIIDPVSLIDRPYAMNPFSLDEDLSAIGELERSRKLNSVVNSLMYIFSSMVGSEFTTKQLGPLKYVLSLLLHIPNASMITLRDIFSDKNGLSPYMENVYKLDENARLFFETQYKEKDFNETKVQISRRLFELLHNNLIYKMFNTNQNKINMYKFMNEGRIVLISTEKNLLQEEGSRFFGRFFISLIAQAIQTRVLNKHNKPAFVFIDEAKDYFDPYIETLFRQARKSSVGITIAHQSLSDIPQTMKDSIRVNTMTKLIGRTDSNDAYTLARSVGCDPKELQFLKKLQFALYANDITEHVVNFRVIPGLMEEMPKRTGSEIEEIMSRNYEMYGISSSNNETKYNNKTDSFINTTEPGDELEDLNKL